MVMTRLPNLFTRSFSWVTTSTVVPSWLIFTSSVMISMERSGSRLPVGSSAMMVAGLFTSARAMATRCCSPPESSLGKFSAFFSRPTSCKTYVMRCLISFFGIPTARMTNSRFSYTVFFSIRRKS